MTTRCLTLLLLPALLACSTPEPERIVVATFNAGLTELFVEHTPERAPLVAEALSSFEADVVCLQEVWSSEHADAIREATAQRFDASIVIEPSQETVPGACDAALVEPLATCVAAACSDPPDPACILESCTAEFEAQEGECGSCLAANLGKTIAEIQDACTTESGRFQYDGSYGLMLLSRVPIVRHGHLELDASLNRRGVLHAELDNGVHVFCTHLTAVETAPYPVDGGSWEEEQRAQIELMLTYTHDMAPSPAPAIAMGDLNVGPAGADHSAEQPDAYGELLLSGWTSAFRDACTFCSDNPLVDDASPSVLIDHVLFREASATAERRLDERVTIESGETALSDHWAVRATVTLN